VRGVCVLLWVAVVVRGEAWRGEVDARRALYMRPASAAALHTLTQLHDALAPAHRHTDMARAQQAAVTAWVPPPQPPDLEAQHGVGADSKARLCCALLAVQDHMLRAAQAHGAASRSQLELRASRSTRGGGGAGCIRSRSFAASIARPARHRRQGSMGLTPRTVRRCLICTSRAGRRGRQAAEWPAIVARGSV
jgi:hypothetical protein